MIDHVTVRSCDRQGLLDVEVMRGIECWTEHCLLKVTFNVIYWPSTEPSTKRCTCVNKRKNSGNRWTLENNITRCLGGSSQLETGYRSENQLKTEGFGPLVTPGWATKTKMQKECCYGRGRTWVNIAVLPCLQSFLTHTTQFSKISVRDLYKEVYSFVIEVVIISWLCSAYICICICVYLYYGYTTLRWKSKLKVNILSLVYWSL